MRVLIVSDTHGRNDNFLRLIEKLKPLDMVIHCGDLEGAEYLVSEVSGCPTRMVMGNNDFFAELPKEDEFELNGLRTLVTHGHYYYVSMGVETLRTEAIARGIQLVFFGHTHKPYLDISDELVIMNPGSLSYPRQDGKKPSYGIMETDASGKTHFEICYLD